MATVSWALHCFRNSNSAVWAAPLLSLRTSSELESFRSHNSGRPGTRAQPGFIQKRWAGGVRAALEHLSKHKTSCDHLFDRGKVLLDGTPSSVSELLERL